MISCKIFDCLKHFVFATMFAAILLSSISRPLVSAEDDALFEKEIRPLLVKNCFRCHSGNKSSGGLKLDSRVAWQKGGESGPAIVPGKPEVSLLIQAVNHKSLEMPPKDEGEKLSDAEIAALTNWVKQGAYDPRDEVAKLGGMNETDAMTWWAFQPLQATDSPATSPHIDSLLNSALAEHSLAVSSKADRRTLIRRATYDLIGLPPTPEEVDHFINDPSDDAFTKLVDSLLDSPQYGVKWGRNWMDVVRYADTAGENTDRPLPHAWRYRNWVIDAMNRDLPYEEFVRLQIAGDILNANGTPDEFHDGIVATGYLAIARRFGHDSDKDIHLMHEDVIDNLGKTFLGLSISCARCHDHKFDPITAEDYYALYGIFNSTKFAFPGCEAKGKPRDLVPIQSESRLAEQKLEWEQKNGKNAAQRKAHLEAISAKTAQLKQTAATAPKIITEAQVNESQSVSFSDAVAQLTKQQQTLKNIAVRRGEVLQLIISPNQGHGADSTLVEWQISEIDGAKRQWNLSELIPNLLESNPHNAGHGAKWCFLDVTDGPKFLTDKHSSLENRTELNSWTLGELPSVFVNRSDEPVSVWTKLPAKSVFVHPGINRPVAIAWVAPDDCVLKVEGRVMDAHPIPNGGDGVSFRLEHVQTSEYGTGLVNLGELLERPIPEVDPQPNPPVAYAVVEGEPKDAPLHQRGDPEKPGNTVARRWVSILGGDPVVENSGSGRQQLGDWIATHPLTARVMVNRIWQWHFGRGLVATPNDFGSRGQLPSHPELLECLANHFVANDYSVKTMHRLIMNTQAYQRSGFVADSIAIDDPDNQFLSHFTRRRLSAEELRDSLLCIGGNIDMTPAQQHPFPAEETWGFTQHNPFIASYATNRRSVYLMVQRQQRHEYLALFDGADPNASTPVRQKTSVPTQALYFLNSPFYHDQAKRLSERIIKLDNQDAQIDFVFNLVYQRNPDSAERNSVDAFLKRYPGETAEKWAAFARVILASNEFIYIE